MADVVLDEIRAVAECLPAIITLVQLLSSVNSLVYNVVRMVDEGFPTFHAFEWFLLDKGPLGI